MKRSRNAFTMVELMVGLSITTMLLMSTMSIITATAKGLARTQSSASMAGQARQGMEMVLYQVRGAESTLASQSINGTTWTTGPTSVVMRAPAYDPATTGLILDGKWDTIAVRYDSAKRQLLQSVVPATGSKRPAGSNRVIAKNIESVDIAYTVRDSFNYQAPAQASSATFTLSNTPVGTPVCTVNGVAKPVTVNNSGGSNNCGNGSTSPNTVTISAPGTNANVQFLYRVDPATCGSSGLQSVSGVEIVLKASEVDNNGVRRTSSLTGEARMRNNRR